MTTLTPKDFQAALDAKWINSTPFYGKGDRHSPEMLIARLRGVEFVERTCVQLRSNEITRGVYWCPKDSKDIEATQRIHLELAKLLGYDCGCAYSERCAYVRASRNQADIKRRLREALALYR